MSYTTKMGRELLRNRKPIPNIPLLRWSDTLPAGFVFQWKANWNADRASKESGLIWQIWHRATAVHEWRARISPQLETKYLTYCSRESESILHIFWECSQIVVAWTFAFHILSEISPRDSHIATFNSWHAFFAQQLSRNFQALHNIWIYLRNVTLWSLWVAKNDITFNQQRWLRAKLEGTI
jgi:hypothetical protein